jgi:hypothetical protein
MGGSLSKARCLVVFAPATEMPLLKMPLADVIPAKAGIQQHAIH